MFRDQRGARNDIRSEVHMNWDDPWGSALSNLGGVCDVLAWTDNEEMIPESAGYRPGAGGPDVTDYPAAMFAEMWKAELIDAESLAYWARVLSRYADLVPEDRRY